jgi:putative ABC transport system permease protein
MSNRFIAFNGGPTVETLTYFFRVSPGWMDTMKVRLLRGRDLLPTDAYPNAAIVNETFARTYFNGENPVGRTFEITRADRTRVRIEIVGQCVDARYNSIVEPITPIAYVPFTSLDDKGETAPNRRASINVRTTGANPLALAAQLRREVTNFRSGFRVSNLRTEQEIVEQHTLRERLLAMLALFFSIVALVLAAVGLYGVLDYSVLQRRREIGIRLALGSPVADVMRGVTLQTFTMVAFGAIVGAAAGYASQSYLETLVFGVKPNDWSRLATPAAILMAAALAASIVPTLRALRLDPIQTLRWE